MLRKRMPMNSHLESRQRRRELVITVSYSFFSVFMIIVSAIQNWPIFYIPLIAGEIALVWWNYIKQLQNYSFRAFLVSFMTSLNVFLYGIQGENFNVLIPTLCVEFVLLSLYEITRIMDIAIFKNALLLAYHFFIKHSFIIPDDTTQKNRMLLQIVSLVILTILCLYRIRHHVQEETDAIMLENQVHREQKIKDDFMANTSHELRTPVNTIAGMCEILLQKSLPDDIHRGVLDIQMTSTELQNIVTDIMDYAALDSGKLELSPRPYNITSTLNDVMNRTVFDMKDKNLELIFDCDPNIPCLLEGDELQLRRVLNNLVSNAIKFTNEGGVIVKVSYRPEDYGINLIISVKDTGSGLSLEEQDQITRGFYQTDSDRNRRNSGIGLGLPISTELIKKMDGFLTIKSQVGEGSEFSFAIPQKVLNDQPCISISHPGQIKLVWYYNPPLTVSSIREAFMEQVDHFSDYFGIFAQRATSLEECKRRISQGQGVHLIIGQHEYMANKQFFDELSKTVPVILIAKRNEALNPAPHIHVLYTPYNALMLAEILNGREQASATRKREKKKFIAPTAKILVVDDNLMNLKVVEGLLRKYRVRLVAAYSGEDALNIVDSKDFDLVFMDHMMPGMDGVECFHLIRAKEDPYFAHVPIVALTANAITGSREMFLAEGFNEFVAKPIDTTHLDDVLRRFIPFEKQIYDDDRAGATKEEIAKAAQEINYDNKTEESSKGAAPETTSPAATETQEVNAPTPSEEGDPFDKLQGIDKDTALMYCGDLGDFKELAQIYCENGKDYLMDLQTSFDSMDLKQYSIISHTVKSTSKTLGALHLSDLAFAQEMAAKEERQDDVKAQHEEFKDEYSKVLKMLGEFVGLETPAEEGESTKSEEDRAPSPGVNLDFSKDIGDWMAIKEKLLE